MDGYTDIQTGLTKSLLYPLRLRWGTKMGVIESLHLNVHTSFCFPRGLMPRAPPLKHQVSHRFGIKPGLRGCDKPKVCYYKSFSAGAPVFAHLCLTIGSARHITYNIFEIFLKGRKAIIKKKYSRLSLSRSQRDPQKNFEISELRHIRFAELRKIPIKLPNFTNEHVT